MGTSKENEHTRRANVNLDFISSFVLKSLRIKNEKWQQMLSVEEQKEIIIDWIHNANNLCLQLTLNQFGLLEPNSQITRGKSVYFIKKCPSVIDEKTFQLNVMYGCISHKPIDDISILFQEVFYPLLNNPANQQQWPHILVNDVIKKLDGAGSLLDEVRVNFVNKTILRVTVAPEIITSNMETIKIGKNALIDPSFRNSVESVVLKWMTQINEALKQTKVNQKPRINTLNHEIKYWQDRKKLTDSLYRQLCNKPQKEFVLILEKIGSVYQEPFAAVFKKLIFDLHEANDVSLWLTPLLQHMKSVEEHCFLECERFIHSFIHIAFLVLANSKFYCTTKLAISFLQKCCNFLVTRAADDLNLPILFHGEIDEGLQKVKATSKLLQTLRTLMENYRHGFRHIAKHSLYDPVEKLSPQQIYTELDNFLLCLEDIVEVCQRASYFEKLEHIVVGGIHGDRLTAEMKKIRNEFRNAFQKWSLQNENFGNTTRNKVFKLKNCSFIKTCEAFETRLTTFIVKAFEECANVYQLHALVRMTNELIRRPQMSKQLKKLTPFFHCLLEADFKVVEKQFRELHNLTKTDKLSKIPTDRYFPWLIGVLMYVKKIRKKMETLGQTISYIMNELCSTELKSQLNLERRSDEIIVTLESIEYKICSKWLVFFDENLRRVINQPVLSRDSMTKLLQLHSEKELRTLLRELKLLSNLKPTELPKSALVMKKHWNRIWILYTCLSCIVELYNSIRSDCSQPEWNLLVEDVQQVDVKLEEIFTIITWLPSDFRVQDLIREILTDVKDISCRLRTSQKRIDLLVEHIRSFQKCPLFQRNTMGLLDTSTDINNSIKNTLMQDELSLENVLPLNFCCFFKIPSIPRAINSDQLQDFIGALSQEKIRQFQLYEEHVRERLERELFLIIKKSLIYVKSQIEGKSNVGLFEVILELNEGKPTFAPSFDMALQPNFKEIVEDILDRIVGILDILPKIIVINSVSTECRATIADLKLSIVSLVLDGMNQAENFALSLYDKFKFLWNDLPPTNHHWIMKDSHRPLHNENYKFIQIENIKHQIDFYHNLYEETQNLRTSHILNGWLKVDSSSFKQTILNHVSKRTNYYKQCLVENVQHILKEMKSFIDEGNKHLTRTVKRDDFEGLLHVMEIVMDINKKDTAVNIIFEQVKYIASLLKSYHIHLTDEEYHQMDSLSSDWDSFKSLAADRKHSWEPIEKQYEIILSKRMKFFNCTLESFRLYFNKLPLFRFPCDSIYELCNRIYEELCNIKQELVTLMYYSKIFSLTPPDDYYLQKSLSELKQLKQLWDVNGVIESCCIRWEMTAWKDIDCEEVESECKNFSKYLRLLDYTTREWEPYVYLEGILKEFSSSVRVISELQCSALTERHWEELMISTKLTTQSDLQDLMGFFDSFTSLRHLLPLKLYRFEEDIKATAEKATKEMEMSKTLSKIDMYWNSVPLEFGIHSKRGINVLKVSEEVLETLEDNLLSLQQIIASKCEFLQVNADRWQKSLTILHKKLSALLEVQKKWNDLESIFISSPDIRTQLPSESAKFEQIDDEFVKTLTNIFKMSTLIDINFDLKLYDQLQDLLSRLATCEKALSNYLETKRRLFPRFYFISSENLLDILSNGNNLDLINCHLPKLFDSILKLKFSTEANRAIGMYAKEGDEYVTFSESVDCSERAEIWLSKVVCGMRSTLRHLFAAALEDVPNMPREKWLRNWPSQVVLCCSQITWTSNVNAAFKCLEEGYESAMKDYYKVLISQLNSLITLLLGELSARDRQKIMTICTIDVHCRDVVAKIIRSKLQNSASFQWQSQLKHRWDSATNHCYGNICDAEFKYAYEYLGNSTRLVITPLTDRCYITLTQSLHLVMGGAPAGPAGTGKTETTKDLGRALGVMVYVFNCSEQMDFKSCGNIYKGLAQTGAWGCFDEFNRISAEVLSVVAVQVKTIQDAIKEKKSSFIFMGEQISLNPAVGVFVTMNPGYAGRTELPANLKTLFRPCAMVVPDFELICEIMLVAQGFQEARNLAHKFVTLYTLCKELLSKQDHYDWGLRAIKSVLVVAGLLKRNEVYRPEDEILMRALRDFNVPKIVSDDIPIFLGLIHDLFPNVEIPRKRLPNLERDIKKTAIEMKLVPEENFVLKIVQLEELLEVRHSVFIVGSSGTGKTKIWQTLLHTYRHQGVNPQFNLLNPKSVSNAGLFGALQQTTGEWKDGLFSSIIREQSKMSNVVPRWIILDGDIDPLWIESLNTLMDDNKVLTLANNERITLQSKMRLLFEVGHLKAATPASVSRAGVLYLNPHDLGWYPIVSAWIETRENVAERAILANLFETYFPKLLEDNKKFPKITPIPDISIIQMTCHIMECLLNTTKVTATENTNKSYERLFAFATIWGFGSAICHDGLVDWRKEFHKWWKAEFRNIDLPSRGTMFDYFFDTKNMSFVPWSEIVAPFQSGDLLQGTNVFVPTIESTRIIYFMKLLISNQRPFLLIGGEGCGKKSMFNEYCTSISDTAIVQKIYFNFFSNSETLQNILEKPLEKKSGKYFTPPNGKKLVYLTIDLNMPEVDSYGTVQAHTILRQFLDYQNWYDRSKLTLKEIKNCQLVATMNPTAGSFTVDPRLQRHFCTFAVSNLSDETLMSIYSPILSRFLYERQQNFNADIKLVSHSLARAAILLHRRVQHCFLPTALKFHYTFNLRDLNNIIYGVFLAGDKTFTKPVDVMRLFAHEATRVYHDRLADTRDTKVFKSLIKDAFRKEIEDLDEDYVFSEPLIYSHFSNSLVDQSYDNIKGWSEISKLLMEAQEHYNETVGHMNLVLFTGAVAHVCRINRILNMPLANALLIGVGGSGKQTLAKLAAFISSLTIVQFKSQANAGIKEDLTAIYTKVGIKNISSVLLLLEAQTTSDVMIYINDILSSGQPVDLFNEDQMEAIVNRMRNEVKQSGLEDTKDMCWNYFISKVKHNLKIVLCISPIGRNLRVTARSFPAILGRMTIDWFHEWPKEALEFVSKKFLEKIPILPINDVEPISKFMAYVHKTVDQISIIYQQNERRYNYTTPKMFLELIALYTKLLTEKTNQFINRIEHLESGMSKLTSCAREVDKLQEQLSAQENVLSLKNKASDKLIRVVQAESEKVQREKFIASEEEKRVKIMEEDISIKTKVCEEDLRKAKPALVAAMEALNTLNKQNLTELKSFGSPPRGVINVCAAVMVLLARNGRLPQDRSWKAAKMMMNRVDQFLYELINYDKDNIPQPIIEAVQPYVNDPQFSPEKILFKSVAAAGLCAWVINLLKYHQVYLIVGPKQIALNDSQMELQAARQKLDYLKRKIQNLETKLFSIQCDLDDAVAEKEKLQKEACKTSFTIDLANRLINGLASENIRWKETICNLREKIGTLPGDILLISCFLSYVGCFTKRYREELQDNLWMPTFRKIEPRIPHTKGLDPLLLVTEDAQVATWNNEGLPLDRMSTENATILTNSIRWPLMIDPQLQGIKWIRNKFRDRLKVVHFGQTNFYETVEEALVLGEPVLIENIEETLDPTLHPLINREFVKNGRFIKLFDRDVAYNPMFRLILHTKLSNPHYKPEIQAQLTLINFTVTREGLEDQLLGEVVRTERPDLEKLKIGLTIEQNSCKILLKNLEEDLLHRLAFSSQNVLENHDLVLNLEKTKKTVKEIEQKVEELKKTSKQIDDTRNIYRPASVRASILYFVLDDLHKMSPIYQFSLTVFMIVFKRAILKTPQHQDPKVRVSSIIDSITYETYTFTSRGLFEKDKLIFVAQLAVQILLNSEYAPHEEVGFLLRSSFDTITQSPLEFLSSKTFGGIRALSLLENFTRLDKDIVESPKRWLRVIDSCTPEKELLPGEWKFKTPLQRLCILRVLRQDRILHAVRYFVAETLGQKYTRFKSPSLLETLNEMTSSTPVLFILSPGVDPVAELEKLWLNINDTQEKTSFHNISLGQGQECMAEKAFQIAIREGHWLVLQNIHLVQKWLPSLEKLIDSARQNAPVEFRLFLTAEPPAAAECNPLPQALVKESIKITNEPPTGMAANIHKAVDNFKEQSFDLSSHEAEFRTILFSLCYFHAVISERRKFGPQGWNIIYAFNAGDLKICSLILYNYLEGNFDIPWEDLRYLFGEIIYGGHITDDWDRRVCQTYLERFMQQGLVDGTFELCPEFLAPSIMDQSEYHSYVDEFLPAESPALYGLHANAEVCFLQTASANFLISLFELQPRESEISTTRVAGREEIVKPMIDDITERLPELLNLEEMMSRTEIRNPFFTVAVQECTRMNYLISVIRTSLRELQLGLKGELTITAEMEKLDDALYYNRIPERWEKVAYPSVLGLHNWILDLVLRVKELLLWSTDFSLPESVWLGGLFNPQSFLTAIMQDSARKHSFQLDKMCLSCEVTQKTRDFLSAPPNDGAFVHGLFLEGARWDFEANSIVDPRKNELFFELPVVHLTAVLRDKQEKKNVYECPLYKTRTRGATYVWKLNLNTREPCSKWIIGGVALLLQT